MDDYKVWPVVRTERERGDDSFRKLDKGPSFDASASHFSTTAPVVRTERERGNDSFRKLDKVLSFDASASHFSTTAYLNARPNEVA